MITPTISDEAREAASQERVHEDWVCGMREDYPVEKANLPVGYHVQLAIDKATAPLTQENERLKATIELLERGKYGRTDMAMQILELQEENRKLKEAGELEKAWREGVAAGASDCGITFVPSQNIMQLWLQSNTRKLVEGI